MTTTITFNFVQLLTVMLLMFATGVAGGWGCKGMNHGEPMFGRPFRLSMLFSAFTCIALLIVKMKQ